MKLEEKDFRVIALIILLILLIVLAFMIVRPVILSVIGGLLLAYTFYPIYKWTIKIVKYPSISAGIVSVIVILLIALPIWFLTPILIQQVFDLFQLSQGLDVHGFISSVLPAGSDKAAVQISVSINSAISNLSSQLLNSMVDLLLNFPLISLHLLLVAFVFFFTLWDLENLKEFAAAISPMNKTQEKIIVKQFHGITRSIVYGQVAVGLLQGILAGIGFLIFGIPNAFLLTALALILSIIPIIGPSLIYIPLALYLMLTGDPLTAAVFLLYNLIIVSSIDNVLRAGIVSRRTKVPQVLILIGMIGGLLVFGILGLIIGPLVLAYFLTFLRAYKERTLSSAFAS